ncbi:MAG TPA: lytic murein transglycosylase [Acetobacteraceae bacterium]|jgi:membrane-bound lytic murein transglycosylase B|nr:lytic murein transglycosylase [Acetobacteraceae bacterium]
MITRRLACAGALALAAGGARAQSTPPYPPYVPPPGADGSFARYVEGVKAEARRRGMSSAMLERAYAGVQINPKVIDLDRHQPESTLTWAQYRARIVSDTRVARGRPLYAQNRALIHEVGERYGVGAGVLMGIWGIESDFGRLMGDMNVIEALTTLAWDGRREKFFRSELMDALRILDRGDVAPERMTGSWAGAMGQTQFMPDSFLQYAVDYSGDGRRDIWTNLGDVFASTANCLARTGWRAGLPWGVPVVLPPGFDAAQTGRQARRPVGMWARLGVQRARGGSLGPEGTNAAIILPGHSVDEAYLVYASNYQAIRSYNPSDFYCVSVGLLGDVVTA